MTTTKYIQNRIGSGKVGKATDIDETDSNRQYDCILEPSKELACLKVFGYDKVMSGERIFDTVRIYVEELGFLSLFGCSVKQSKGTLGPVNLNYFTLEPLLIVRGNFDLLSIGSPSFATIYFPLHRANVLPDTFRVNPEMTRVDRLRYDSKFLYDDDDISIKMNQVSSMRIMSEHPGSRDVFIEGKPYLDFRFKANQSFQECRQLVVHSCLLLSAFFFEEIACVKELYGFEDVTINPAGNEVYDRQFHINTKSPIGRFEEYCENVSLSLIGSVLGSYLAFVKQYPSIGDIFWHSTIHSKSFRRVLVDSFLKAGRLAEEVLDLMNKEGVLVKKNTHSNIQKVLKQIHAVRPFRIFGNWDGEFFWYFQDTRNLYAHGDTKGNKEKILYGYDVNFMAFTVHIHLFAILGELLGLEWGSLRIARDQELEKHHRQYLTRRKIGSPLSQLTNQCEWRFK